MSLAFVLFLTYLEISEDFLGEPHRIMDNEEDEELIENKKLQKLEDEKVTIH